MKCCDIVSSIFWCLKLCLQFAHLDFLCYNRWKILMIKNLLFVSNDKYERIKPITCRYLKIVGLPVIVKCLWIYNWIFTWKVFRVKYVKIKRRYFWIVERLYQCLINVIYENEVYKLISIGFNCVYFCTPNLDTNPKFHNTRNIPKQVRN